MFRKRGVIPPEDVAFREEICSLPDYGRKYSLHHHVPLSLFLDPDQYADRRERECVFLTKARFLFVRPGPMPAPLLAVGFDPDSNPLLVAQVLARAKIPYLTSDERRNVMPRLLEALRIPQVNIHNSLRRGFINDKHWKSLRFVEKLSRGLAEIGLPEIVVLSEVAMRALIEGKYDMQSRDPSSRNQKKHQLLLRSSFDIVILRKNHVGETLPVLAIEVDGNVHKVGKKKETDALKNEICREAGLCVLRLTTDNTLNFSYERWLDDSHEHRYKRTPIDLLHFIIKRTIYEIAGFEKEIDQWEDACVRRGTNHLDPIERRMVEDELWANQCAYSVRPRPENSEQGLQMSLWELGTLRNARVRYELKCDDDAEYIGVLKVSGDTAGTDLFLVSRAVRIAGFACREISFSDLARWALGNYLVEEALDIPLSRQIAERRGIRPTRLGLKWHPIESEYLNQGIAEGKSLADLAFALQRSVSSLEDQLKKREIGNSNEI